MLDEHEWKYVLQAASDGTFSGAARHLFVSQPSLSQCIKKIEGELGTPLFDRRQTPLTLTAAGKIYVRKAKEIQRIAQELVKKRLILPSFVPAAFVLAVRGRVHPVIF